MTADAGTNTRPLASLSLDLDNLWAYMKTHGDPGWEDFPSYLDVVVPRVLAFLAERRLIITFFIVGQDAALAKNGPALAAIAAAGHEIANHSFRHEPWLPLYPAEELEDEIARAEQAIEAATGQRPVGFRGPGFSLSAETLATLKRRGYRYDASTFPTFLGPVARAYYFFAAGLSKEQRAQRKHLFGGFRECLRPNRPYRWRLAQGPLTELPVTTMPGFKVPIHLSYLIYLAGFSPAVARLYFRTALLLCRAAGIQPSLLLHPLDFLGADDVDALRFFPGMTVPAERKLAWVDGFLADYARRFDVVTMARHVDVLETSTALPLVEPRFT
jgi:peptidoglycan/xylan/chitin deacetylase (PgdA/CDA1 family)